MFDSRWVKTSQSCRVLHCKGQGFGVHFSSVFLPLSNEIQGRAKLPFPGLVDLAPAVAYRFCLNLLEKSSQASNSILAQRCTGSPAQPFQTELICPHLLTSWKQMIVLYCRLVGALASSTCQISLC